MISVTFSERSPGSFFPVLYSSAVSKLTATCFWISVVYIPPPIGTSRVKRGTPACRMLMFMNDAPTLTTIGT